MSLPGTDGRSEYDLNHWQIVNLQHISGVAYVTSVILFVLPRNVFDHFRVDNNKMLVYRVYPCIYVCE